MSCRFMSLEIQMAKHCLQTHPKRALSFPKFSLFLELGLKMTGLIGYFQSPVFLHIHFSLLLNNLQLYFLFKKSLHSSPLVPDQIFSQLLFTFIVFCIKSSPSSDYENRGRQGRNRVKTGLIYSHFKSLSCGQMF